MDDSYVDSTTGILVVDGETANSSTDSSNSRSQVTVIDNHVVNKFEQNDDRGGFNDNSTCNGECNEKPKLFTRQKSDYLCNTFEERICSTVKDQKNDYLLDSCSATSLPLLCPIGLESLLDAGQLVIHTGRLRHDIFFNVRNKKRMEVINEMRRLLFYVEQEPSPLSENSFLFKLYNRNKEEVMQVYSPGTNTCLSCGVSWHWFKFCQFEAIVYAPLGVIIGFIRQHHTCFVQEFQVLNPQEELLLRLRGSPSDLEIYSHDLQHGLGRLSIHNWVGVMHEIRRTANDFGLTFPIDLDIRVKCLLMAAVFVIDWLYSKDSDSD